MVLQLMGTRGTRHGQGDSQRRVRSDSGLAAAPQAQRGSIIVRGDSYYTTEKTKDVLRPAAVSIVRYSGFLTQGCFVI